MSKKGKFSGDEIIADLDVEDGPEVDLEFWSTNVLKIEKLSKNNNDIETEATSLDDKLEEKGFGTDLDSLY